MKLQEAFKKIIEKIESFSAPAVEEQPEKKKFETAMLPDGSTLEYESKEVGSGIFISKINEETQETEQIPAPAGEYVLESGEIIVIIEDGIIAEVKQVEETPAEDEEMSTEEPQEIEMSNEELATNLSNIFDKVMSRLEAIENSNKEAQEMSKTELSELKQKFEDFSKSASQEPVKFKKISSKSELINNRLSNLDKLK